LVNTVTFKRRLDLLALAVRQNVPVREVYVSGYPNQVLLDGACGMLGGVIAGHHVPLLGIDRAEAKAMHVMGIALNRQIERLTVRHQREGWNYLEDPTAVFAPHRYCGRAPWFNHLEQSWTTQGDEMGTVHPNRAGHRAFSALLLRGVVPDQPAKPFRTVPVRIDAVRSTLPGRATLAMVLRQYPRDPVGVTRTATAVGRGAWTSISATAGTFVVPVFRAPASPRHATRISIIVRASTLLPSAHPTATVPLSHGFADGYGAGAHVLTRGTLSVRYHVTVTNTGPVIGAS
jgi:hypothetical protein